MTRELEFITKKLGVGDINDAFYFPKYFEIETIRACNARCSMCTVQEWQKRNNKMGEVLFSKIVGEMQKYNKWIERVCLSRNGEPLLDKKLPDRIKRLKEIGIKYVTFSTNASILNEKKARELIESGLDDIRFSVDGIRKETFESIRIGLNYELIRDNCLRFIQIRNSYGKSPKIHIRMTLQEKNKDEEKDWRDYWNSKVSGTDIVSSKPMHSWGNQLKDYKGLDKEEKIYEGLPCISPWSTMITHFDGSVPLCGCDYNNKFLLGNINKSLIQKVWQSEKFEDVRGLHLSGKKDKIELCRGCNVWDDERKIIYKR